LTFILPTSKPLLPPLSYSSPSTPIIIPLFQIVYLCSIGYFSFTYEHTEIFIPQHSIPLMSSTPQHWCAPLQPHNTLRPLHSSALFSLSGRSFCHALPRELLITFKVQLDLLTL
jgi:hypothetical protein